ETLVEAALLVALTLLGGLQWLDLQWGRAIDSEMWRQLALIGSVVVIVGLVGLPFSIWRKFGLEARFGFNRMTPRLFAMDLAKALLLTLILGAPLVAVVLWVMGNAGPQWIWWAWAVWVGFNFLVIW